MARSKICFKCGVEKDLDAFYQHPKMADGHVNKCKECNKRDVIENRVAKADYYHEYEKGRARLPHRVAARKDYAQTERGKAAQQRAANKYIGEYPERRKAVNAVNNAVRDGRLVKAPCMICGREDSHGHHDNYARPLEVTWLCPLHHFERHKTL